MPVKRGAVVGLLLLCIGGQASAGPKKTGPKPKPGAATEVELAPLAPPEAKAPEQAGVRRVEAYADQEPKGPESPAPMVTAPEVPTATEPNLFIGVRGGGLVPLSFLRPGYQVGLEGQLRLPVLDGRLRASLAFGIAQAAGKESRLVPTRGYEAAFIENLTAWPLELSGHYQLWDGGAQGLAAGAGYALYFLGVGFQALGTSSSKTSIGHAGLAALTYRLTLGPGELGASLRGTLGAASLGSLGRVGTDSLSSVSFTLSYSAGFHL
ncbi:MAG: hypothetical protein ACYC8T_30195 [Myxococcaceae bacterium]